MLLAVRFKPVNHRPVNQQVTFMLNTIGMIRLHEIFTRAAAAAVSTATATTKAPASTTIIGFVVVAATVLVPVDVD